MIDNLPSAPDLATAPDDVDRVLQSLEDGVPVDDVDHEVDLREWKIYSHGFTVRINLMTPQPEVAVAKLGWAEDSKNWLRSTLKHGDRWVLRGSTFLTGAAPRNKRLPMSQANRRWRTKLYSIEYDRGETGHFLVLRGVRHDNIQQLLQERMELKPDEYEVAYYLDLERYIVLAFHEAMRLASALGGVAETGRGRLTRKHWLLRNHAFEVTVRTRSKRTAKLSIYWVLRGATAQCRVEVSLKGRKQHRTHFHPSDIVVLDQVLLGLVEQHQLHPVAKPDRWEPRSRSRWRRDPRLASLSAKAYRGPRVPEERVRLARNCNTPVVSVWVETAVSSHTSPDQPLIRTPVVSEQPHFLSALVWNSVAEDIERYEGYLSEVVLDPEQDPDGLLMTLVARRAAGQVAVALLAADDNGRADCWISATRFALAHPLTEFTDTVIVVVDWSVVMGIEDAVEPQVGDQLHSFSRGPLYPAHWQPQWGIEPLWIRSLGACWSPLFDDLRRLCETTGLRVVVVTVDCRPDHGRGPLLRTHYYRDGRVRSLLGDAARHFSHTRYLVESGQTGPVRAVMWKDEGEGLVGRVLFGDTGS